MAVRVPDATALEIIQGAERIVEVSEPDRRRSDTIGATHTCRGRRSGGARR
jgi:hypothetical protein